MFYALAAPGARRYIRVSMRPVMSAVVVSALLLACGESSEEQPGTSGSAGMPQAGTLASEAGSAGKGAGGSSDTSAGSPSGDAGSQATSGSGNGGANAGTGGADSNGTGGMHVIDPALPPGQNYDLSAFALQLPLAQGDSVQQIVDPALREYTSDFFYSGEDGAMVFWCPVTGATTQNSHYPRTELRERPVGGDWAIDGHHKLTASFKMLENPASKGTIIGQIHGNATGGTSEVLKLEWTSDNEIVASVEANDQPSKQIDHPMGKYELGELVSYTFELNGGVLDITVTGAGGDAKYSTPYTAASWKQDEYYFKLGSYVQLDTGPATDGGRVAFYSFAIEHGP
jgi:hypothetical protein